MVTFDQIREIALKLPGVEDGTSYGTPALKVKGKLLARLKEDGQSVVFRVTFDQRDLLMQTKPKIFFITDHYLNYEWVLVNLATVTTDALDAMISRAHQLAKKK